MLNQLSSSQRECIKLWYLVQHSITAYRKIIAYFGSCEEACQTQQLASWSKLALHVSHLKRRDEFLLPQGQQQFEKLLAQIQQSSDFIVTSSCTNFPQQLLPYDDCPPILFGRGQIHALLQPQIAMVGSRKPSPHGRQVAYDFAHYLSNQGFYITSGLAHGIDEAAHQGGLMHARTIAVMGTGLDQIYPSQNQHLANKIIQSSGAIISEFLPGTPPLQQNFPRRNRIVSGLSLGVLVVEATLKSGSLITAQKAAEQGKSVFAIPGHIYSEHHQGCHQLIREGAILIDHPEQIIEDLALPTQWQSQKNEAIDHTLIIPEVLLPLYQQLDWVGQDIDQLAFKLQLPIADLTAQLMELEILGLSMQQSGLYMRCRSMS